jgi:hypothetical protein
MPDEIQENATKEITAFRNSVLNVQIDALPGSVQTRIATELIRLRYEMTAIRQLLEKRGGEVIDAGEF